MTAPDAVRQLGAILGIWAHPDDEVYLSGALMTLAAAAGSRVACVTATAASGGRQMLQDGPWRGFLSYAAELTSCLDKLGVSEHYWLDAWQLAFPSPRHIGNQYSLAQLDQ